MEGTADQAQAIGSTGDEFISVIPLPPYQLAEQPEDHTGRTILSNNKECNNPATIYKQLRLEPREGRALINPHEEAGSERVCDF